MTEKNDHKERLRQKAEAILKTRKEKPCPGTDTACRVSTEADKQKVMHELEVHQIELEMQNDELRHAWAVAEVANDKYVELYDFAPSGHFSISNMGIILELNLNGAKMVGKERSQLLNRHFAVFLSIDSIPIFNCFLEKAFLSKAKESCEVTLVSEGNLPVHVYLTGLVAGENEKCHLIAVDITERKKAEEALAESELRYRTLSNSGQALIWTATPDKKCDYFNQVWLDFTGRTLEQELGDGWAEGVHPDDFDRCFTIYSTSFDQRKSFSMDYRLHYHDGTYRWLQDDGKPRYDSHGEFIGYIGHCLDITDRKQSEEMLRSGEERFRVISEYSSSSICILNITGKVIWVNEAMLKMTGYSQAQVYSAESFTAFLDPGSIGFVVANFLKFGGGEDYQHHYQFSIIRADGEKRLCEKYMSHFKDQDGNRNLIISMTDITDRKKAENLIEKQLQYTKALNDIAEIIISDSNATKILENANRIIGETLQVDRVLILDVSFGKNMITGLCEWLRTDHPDIVATNGEVPLQSFINPFTEVKNTRKHIESQYNDVNRHFLEDGSGDILHRQLHIKSLIWYPFSFYDDGYYVFTLNQILEQRQWTNEEIGFLESVAKQVSLALIKIKLLDEQENAQKELEKAVAERTEQLNLVIKGSNDAPWDWNLVTNHLFYSLKWWQQIGYMPEEIPSDSSLWRNITHPDDLEHTKNIFENTLNSKNDSYEAEFRLLHKDGHYVPVLSRGYITRDESGKPIRVSGTNMDLTERKRTEEEIIRSRDDAHKANLAKSEFLSRMSHELRTPMTSILGFAQLLNIGELNPKQKKGVGYILSSGKHLLDLIDEVLDISRIESGRLKLVPEPVQLSGVIVEMMDTIQPLADAWQLNLEVDNLPDNKLFVISDRKRLKQVLLNLLNNAVKYNREGGSISVKTELLAEDDKGFVSVRISVKDTGMGIEPDDLPKLFNPFERIGAEKTQTEGAGLGLAIVKKIIEAMEGSVGVESIVGQGSTFWIDLPVTGNRKSWKEQKEENSKLTTRLIEAGHEIAFQNEEKAKRAEELAIINKDHSFQMQEALNAGQIATKKTGTVLYIEDNILNAELVEEIIGIHHPEIRLITTMFGHQGIKLATVNLPDLILLDLDLPDITGSDVLASLQANDLTKSIPVVVVTADATPQQIEKLMTSGARDYLTKPLDITMFLQVVGEWIGAKEQP